MDIDTISKREDVIKFQQKLLDALKVESKDDSKMVDQKLFEESKRSVDRFNENQMRVATLGFAIWKWSCTWQLTTQLLQRIEEQNQDKKEIEYAFPKAVTDDWRKGLIAALVTLKKDFKDFLISKDTTEEDLKYFNRDDVALTVFYQNGSSALKILATPLCHLDKPVTEVQECGQIEDSIESIAPYGKRIKVNYLKKKRRIYCSEECLDMDTHPDFVNAVKHSLMHMSEEMIAEKEMDKLKLNDKGRKKK